MPTETKLITATLVAVAQELHARPGDKLLIVAGVCIGVDTGRARPVLEAPPQEDREPAPPATNRRSDTGRLHRSRSEVAAARKRLGDRLVRIVAKQPGITSQRLYAELGISDDETGQRDATVAVQELKRHGRLRTSESRGREGFTFHLIEPGEPAKATQHELRIVEPA